MRIYNVHPIVSQGGTIVKNYILFHILYGGQVDDFIHLSKTTYLYINFQKALYCLILSHFSYNFQKSAFLVNVHKTSYGFLCNITYIEKFIKNYINLAENRFKHT